MMDFLTDALFAIGLVLIVAFVAWTLKLAFQKSFWIGVLCLVFGIALVAFPFEDIRRRWKPVVCLTLGFVCFIVRGMILKTD